VAADADWAPEFAVEAVDFCVAAELAATATELACCDVTAAALDTAVTCEAIELVATLAVELADTADDN
jgi:hypothetical protein